MPEPSTQLLVVFGFATLIACTAICANAYLKARNHESFTTWLIMIAAVIPVLVAVWAMD